ncbi:MAG: hypothetical protein A2521_09135 [Deltaproteobacteria bacterium RIFOXYD12_FULL_57_12]|nr:MAG: hypothetical protein A2521_09135 [Deltaproteobacteria bacterium RIFOXYD12_FULL_57_12]
MDLSSAAVRIPFSRIDWEDITFCLAPLLAAEIPENLRRSVTRVGILHPPLVREKKKNTFQVVAGRKRLQAARLLAAQQSCICLILPPTIPEATLFALLLEDNTICRQLTPVEQAIFFQKALHYVDEEEAARLFLPALELPPHPYHIRRLLGLLELEEPLLLGLHNGFLDESAARELGALPFKDRMTLFEVIQDLRLSVGNQRKLVAICRELATRHRLAVATLLDDQAIRQILASPDANPPQKAANLMAWLSRKRFPNLSEAESNFKKFVGGLQLPGNATITHSPSFEKDTITLSVNFADQEAFLKTWEKIQSALAEPEDS